MNNLEIDIDKAIAELCRRSFFEFVKEFWDVVITEEPVYNWHIPYLCSELQEVGYKIKNREKKDYDVIINIPPGTSKSTICTVMFPAWLWIIDPTIRALTASYSDSLSTDHSLKSRDIIKSDKYKKYFPEISIKRDQDNKTHYKNEKGGERYATSVGGTVTGFHAHVIIVDDPLNPKSAASEAERTTANEFMDVTLSTRKVNKAVTVTILVMQRLHEVDPTGNWLKKKGKAIKHICLPAEISKDIKPTALVENYVGGLLDPIRMDANVLKDIKTDLGSYGYAGQMMQTPTPEGGGIWQKWIIPIADNNFPTTIQNYGTDWDLAYTKDDKNSASAYVSSGIVGNDMYIGDLGFKWLEFPELIKWMKEVTQPHYIEAKASGKSAKQTLKSLGINAVEVKMESGDKISRTKQATPYAESGRIFCKESLLNKLYNDSKQGILFFPNGENNDLNDALVQAIIRLLMKKKTTYKIG
ncbi:MAG: hypothetical protein ACRC8Z_10860 [Empedobacter falsenii]